VAKRACEPSGSPRPLASTQGPEPKPLMPTDPQQSSKLKEQTAVAFAWTALQNWAMKILSLFLFFMLARYLSPADMGVAQSLMLLLLVIGLVAELGLHGAMLAVRNLQADDINLPFFVSVAVALLGSAGMLIFSAEIASELGDSEIDGLVQAAAIVPPLVASTSILVVMLRRAMDFKTIATASMVASLVSAAASLGLAMQGHGAMSIVVQAIVAAAVTAIMIWRRPVWLPSWRLNTARARELFTYSAAHFSATLVEFLAQRLIEFIVLSRYGFSALGLFTVGAKIYMAALELFTGMLLDVALRSMSKISDQLVRFRSAYFRMIFLASGLVVPIFIWVAALAPEICLTLFGAKWVGSDQVLEWFALLGAVQVMHFFNFAALGAMRKPSLNLRFSVVKLVVGAGTLLLYRADSMGELAAAFVLSQLAVAPYGYHLAAKVMSARRSEIIRQLLPSIICTVMSFFLIDHIRDDISEMIDNIILKAALLSLIFFPVFLLPFLVITRGRFLKELRYAADSFPALRRFTA
jgi:O-antigen/teichoic acid export membrane protein